MSTISELKSGAPLVRAMKLGPFFAARQSAFIGAWTHYSFTARALQSWSSHVGGMLAFVLGCITVLYIMGNRDLFTAELGGLALTYAAVVPCEKPPPRHHDYGEGLGRAPTPLDGGATT